MPTPSGLLTSRGPRAHPSHPRYGQPFGKPHQLMYWVRRRLCPGASSPCTRVWRVFAPLIPHASTELDQGIDASRGLRKRARRRHASARQKPPERDRYHHRPSTKHVPPSSPASNRVEWDLAADMDRPPRVQCRRGRCVGFLR